MARIRSLKPEITGDEKLAKVSRDARLTFVYLITQSDDYGLQFGGTRRLLGALYPVDDTVTGETLTAWLDELAAVGVIRYRVTTQGAPVIEIVNWRAHQKVDKPGKPTIRDQLAEVSPNPRETLAEVPRESPPADHRIVGEGSADHLPAREQPERDTPTGRELKYAWLAPIRAEYEAIEGPGSFTKQVEGRFAANWGGIVKAIGGEHAARVWRFSQRDEAQRDYRTIEKVAARWGDFDPDAEVPTGVAA